MTNGNDESRVRLEGPVHIPIKGLFFDANRGLIVPAKGLTHAQLVQMVVSEELGVSLTEDAAVCNSSINTARIELTKLLTPEQLADPVFWSAFNVIFYATKGCSAEQAKRITERITEDVSLYEMPDDRRAFFEWLITQYFRFSIDDERCQVVVASNGKTAVVDALLKRSGIRGLVHHIMASETVGVPKDDPRFYSRILETLKLDAREVLMIGNSAFKDLKAAMLGIWCIWLREKDETIPEDKMARLYDQETLQRIFTAETLEELRQVIERHFVSALP